MHRRRLPVAVVLAVLVATALALPTAATAADSWRHRAERLLDEQHCNVGRVDGRIDDHARAGLVRFQAANGLAQSGRLSSATGRRLRSARAVDCRHRPVPRHSGKGRRVVLSQGQNYVWLVGRRGHVVAQGGIVDNPSVLSPGRYATGSYCGRSARIKYNSDGGSLTLYDFVRFAPCGVGFHQVPYYASSGTQIHPDWLLGTNYRESHGCIRMSRDLVSRVWTFTGRGRTHVRVLPG